MNSDKSKKTSDMKLYMNNYMHEYIKKANKLVCPNCGGHYMSYNKHHHNKTKKHLFATERKESEIDKLKDRIGQLEKLQQNK
jgi:hypothetical protein